MIRRLDASGPSEPPERLFPPAHRRIFRDYPQWGAKKDHDVIRAAVKCLHPLMRRAFRENVSEDEAKAYADLVLQSVKRDESFHRGMQNAIAGILVSPRFLFRIETPPSDWKPEPESLVPGIDLTNNGAKTYDVPLTQHQLATRLSYFLWSSTPDDKLLGAADAGELNDDAVMDHVRRMLDDPKSRTLSQEFAGQWFGLRNLIGFEPDEASLDGFQSELLPMMTRETELLFEHMVGENRPSVELITADYSFLNADLANHYGIDFSSDRETNPDAFRKVSLGDTPRRGLLGHASVLTLTSEPNRTSPVKRGKWILENILGTAPPEPPANVPELDDAKGDTTHLSLRRQLEIHRESPACSACHSVMDQLGFGLENFDAVGRFRLKDGNIEIDSSGELPGGRSFAGATQLSEVLGKTEQQAFAKVVAERLLGFALGRELGPSDRCSVDEIVAATEADGYRISDIISQVIQSRPFRYYQWTVGGEK